MRGIKTSLIGDNKPGRPRAIGPDVKQGGEKHVVDAREIIYSKFVIYSLEEEDDMIHMK